MDTECYTASLELFDYPFNWIWFYVDNVNQPSINTVAAHVFQYFNLYTLLFANKS